jgi:FkbM family methyltransferase
MKALLKRYLESSARSVGLGLTSRRRLEELYAIEEDVEHIFTLIEKSVVGATRHSQLGQDLFVLLETGFKRDGYFVEFGATDGVRLSNTYLLETRYGWTGILAEPSPVWHEALLRNRTASIDFECVWNKTGEKIEFAIPEDPELSTISSYSESDLHFKARRAAPYIIVKSITLNDLLHRHGAPSRIDYLSMDTEGSEFDILKALDFEKYSFSIISCEHNYASNRSNIYDLLTSKGYFRVLSGISKFDDWYVLRR